MAELITFAIGFEETHWLERMIQRGYPQFRWRPVSCRRHRSLNLITFETSKRQLPILLTRAFRECRRPENVRCLLVEQE